MAEGLCRHAFSDEIDCASAGIEKHGLNQRAVAAMHEIGIDISGHQSKTLDDLDSLDFDLVITVCGHADENCPIFPGRTRIMHQGFDDPPRLAQDAASEEAAMQHYRRVRDEIAAFIDTLPQQLAAAGPGPQPQ